MFTTYPVAGIIQYLIQTHNPRAIIVTGSYANGTYNEASDFDCWLIGRDEKRVRHDTSIVNGIELQAEIYPLAYFETMPLHLQRYFADAAIVYDPEGLAEKTRSMEKEEIIALVKEYGIALTEDDFAQMIHVDKQDISDDELENVAGGKWQLDFKIDQNCRYCGQHFTRFRELENHLNQVHNVSSYS